MKPGRCGSCGEEIRHGIRHGREGWWHRLDVDHHPIHGQPFTAEMQAEVERQLDLPRERLASGVASHCPTYQTLWPPEIYTAREHELERYRKSKKFRDAEDVEEVADEPLPPVEIPRNDVTVESFAPTSGIRQMANLVTGVTRIGKKKSDPPAAPGWELRRLTHARGPYMGASGEVLSISDSIVLGARGPVSLDGSRRVAVASWRDGKFDSAYIGILKDNHISTRKSNATEMKDWIKGLDVPNPSDSTD